MSGLVLLVALSLMSWYSPDPRFYKETPDAS